MEIIKKEHKLCLCCMEEHEVQLVRVDEKNTYKGEEIEYKAVYEYCDKADEFMAADNMISDNFSALQKAYSAKISPK